jgi:hypothetical protein
VKKTILVPGMLIAALCADGAYPQAASVGPFKKETQEKLDQKMKDEMALLRDGALFGNSAPASFGEQAAGDRKIIESFFSGLAGRFRIEGVIEGDRGYNAVVGGFVPQTAKITGVADCRSVGSGLGIDCVINATWPVIDSEVAQVGARQSRSEALNTFRPAVLVLGVDTGADPPGVRVQLVTADGFAHGWVGTLAGNKMHADHRVSDCLHVQPPDVRCFTSIEITVEPGIGIVTLGLSTGAGIGISLAMHPDTGAKAERKMKSLK